MFSSSLCAAAVSLLITISAALQIPMRKSPGGIRSHAILGQNSLQNTDQGTEYNFRNLGDNVYTVDIAVGGQPFTVGVRNALQSMFC
jgi:hypothetical protein